MAGAIRLVFEKFRELGSSRQVYLWFLAAGLSLPVVRRNAVARHIEWRPAAYHTIHQILKSPIYAGAYAFGRTAGRTRIVDGRARKTGGHQRAMAEWSVLLRDNHEGYITWERFEENQRTLLENAHMKKRASRKSGRGGRALLTGLARCGRCGRMMRVFYQGRSGHPYRYQCRGGSNDPGLCIGIGGLRIDRAIAARILDAVSPHAVEAALQAAEQVDRAAVERRRAAEGELEEAEYEASLAARRYELVDPAKRHVARELEARWNTALERVEQVAQRLVGLDAERAARPAIDRAALMELARDLPAVWNAPTTGAGTKQRLIRTLIEEVLIDLDEEANEAILTIHWVGGRHSETRVPAEEGRPLLARPQARSGRGHAQARRSAARPRACGHDEQDAMRVRGRRHLDDVAGPRVPGTAGHRRVRSGDGGSRDDQRARDGAPSRDLHHLGPSPDPRGHVAGDTAHAVGSVADPGRGARKQSSSHRRAGSCRPPPGKYQAITRR